MPTCVHVHLVVESLIVTLLFPLEPFGSRTMIDNGTSGGRSSSDEHYPT
jgi:hypothetical protein